MAHATFPSHSRKFSDSSPSPPRSEVPSGSSSSGFESFFFPADSELDVRRDIALLSYLLSHTKVEGQRSGGKAKALDALDPWIYLAFIINTGEAPYDKAGNKDIAVTGRIDREAITAALVARNTSPDALPLQIKSLKPGNPEDGASTLREAIRNPEFVFTRCSLHSD